MLCHPAAHLAWASQTADTRADSFPEHAVCPEHSRLVHVCGHAGIVKCHRSTAVNLAEECPADGVAACFQAESFRLDVKVDAYLRAVVRHGPGVLVAEVCAVGPVDGKDGAALEVPYIPDHPDHGISRREGARFA